MCWLPRGFPSSAESTECATGQRHRRAEAEAGEQQRG